MAKKDVRLIVGLGNPGEKYAHTRHNAGFEVMARLESRFGVRVRRRFLLRGAAAVVRSGGKRMVLCKPLTYMNKSGECVRRLLRRYRCAPENMIVIYDDIDLPPGKIRVRKSGGPGTHNGMRSIVSCIGTQEFPRIRVGTGDRPAGEDLVEWVLGHPGPEEKEKMDAAFDKAAECAVLWAQQDIDAAMRGNK